jgi:rSAM/selenodomain-associated transferase 1
MRPRRHLVIFAKAPILGRVKRRLAAGIGALAALRFQRDNTARLLRRVVADRRWHCWLALTPDRCAAGPRFWRVSCRRIAQGGGDLGRRMARPFARLPAGPVIVIGSDIPAIARHHIAAAFRLIGEHDLVFGPARDGGYWLVGARRRPLPRGLFAGVRWSTAHALGDTLANVPRRLRVGIVATLDDVDDEPGYRRFVRRASRPSDAPGAGA